VEQMTNYQLLTMYKRLLGDGLHRYALALQEEIYMRMEEQQAKPVFTLLKGGIA
jgi:hypothetical protein